MAFEEIFLNIGEKSEDIEYLCNIGYVDVMGNKMKDTARPYYKDKERDIFIIRNSTTDLRLFEGVREFAYVVCINKNPIGVLVEPKSKGVHDSGDYECNWIIKKVVYPKNQNVADYTNIKEIIEEAFIAVTLLQTYYPKGIKGVTVEFMCDNA